MSLHEFWHEDMRLLEVSQKSYMRDKSYTAWINGMYNFEAYSKAVTNGNRSKETDPVLQYNDWQDPLENMRKRNMTEQDKEIEFRNQFAEQQAWLFNR